MLATLHRPSNVDADAVLEALMRSRADASALLIRGTRARLEKLAIRMPDELQL